MSQHHMLRACVPGGKGPESKNAQTATPFNLIQEEEEEKEEQEIIGVLEYNALALLSEKKRDLYTGEGGVRTRNT